MPRPGPSPASAVVAAAVPACHRQGLRCSPVTEAAATAATTAATPAGYRRAVTPGLPPRGDGSAIVPASVAVPPAPVPATASAAVVAVPATASAGRRPCIHCGAVTVVDGSGGQVSTS